MSHQPEIVQHMFTCFGLEGSSEKQPGGLHHLPVACPNKLLLKRLIRKELEREDNPAAPPGEAVKEVLDQVFGKLKERIGQAKEG